MSAVCVSVCRYHDKHDNMKQPCLSVTDTDRHIFEEKVAPFILHVEEEAEDQCDVHDADEEDNNHSRVNGETTP